MKRAEFAVCLENTGNEASLIPGKVYVVVPDAKAGKDGLIRIVSVETGDTIHTFHQHYREEPSYLAHNPQVIWSPDSQRLTVLDRGVLFIYSV